MEYSYLIVALGFSLVVAGLVLLYRRRSGKTVSEFSIWGASIKLGNTSLALIVIGATLFLAPWVMQTRAVPRLRVEALPFKLTEGDSVWIVWHTENCDDVYLTDHRGQKKKVAPSGEEQFLPVEDAQFLLEGARGGRTETVSAKVAVVKAPPEPSIERLAFDPPKITKGDPTFLVWKTRNAARALLSHPDGRKEQVASTSYLKLTPQKDETYTLTLQNGVSALAAVRVTPPVVGQLMGDSPPRIVQFRVSAATIAPGEQATLSWKVSDADRVTISGLGRVSPEGAAQISPRDSLTYQLIAENDAGERGGLVRVEVVEAAADRPPTASLSATPQAGRPGEAVTLDWSTTNARTVTLEPGIGDVSPEGQRTVNLPGASVAYTLTAIGQGNQRTVKEVVVSVLPPWLNEKAALSLRQRLEGARRP